MKGFRTDWNGLEEASDRWVTVLNRIVDGFDEMRTRRWLQSGFDFAAAGSDPVSSPQALAFSFVLFCLFFFCLFFFYRVGKTR